MDNGHYDNRIPGKLAPYEQKVITMRSKGITYKKIHEQIVKEGYTGTIASLRMFMQKERTHQRSISKTIRPDSSRNHRPGLPSALPESFSGKSVTFYSATSGRAGDKTISAWQFYCFLPKKRNAIWLHAVPCTFYRISGSLLQGDITRSCTRDRNQNRKDSAKSDGGVNFISYRFISILVICIFSQLPLSICR